MYQSSRYELNSACSKNVLEVLNDESSKRYYNEFKDSICQLLPSNMIATKYTQFMTQALDRLAEKITIKKLHRKRGPLWYDRQCRQLRSKAINAGHRVETNTDYEKAKSACREYRSIKQIKKSIVHIYRRPLV